MPIDAYEQRGVPRRPVLQSGLQSSSATPKTPRMAVLAHDSNGTPRQLPVHAPFRRPRVFLEEDSSDDSDSDDEIYLVKTASPSPPVRLNTSTHNSTVTPFHESNQKKTKQPLPNLASSVKPSVTTKSPLRVVAQPMPKKQPFQVGATKPTPKRQQSTVVTKPKQQTRQQTVVTTKRPAALFHHSPYERNACAEDGEDLFQQLDTRLNDFCSWEDDLPVREYYRGIKQSALLYSTCWETGEVHGRNLGKPLPPRLLVLSLQPKRICNSSEVSVFVKLCTNNGLDDIVRRAVDEWKWGHYYPKMMAKTSRLIVRRVDTLKSILFICRLHGAMDVLNVATLRDISQQLRYKLQACLAIVEEHVEVNVTRKKRGRRKKETAPMQLEAPAPQVDVTSPLPMPPAKALHYGAVVEMDNSPKREVVADTTAMMAAMDQGGLKRKAEDSQSFATVKHRRVSLDAGKSTIVLPSIPPDGDILSFAQRLDQLEEYFSLGLEEVRRLREQDEAAIIMATSGLIPKQEPRKNFVSTNATGGVGSSLPSYKDDHELEEEDVVETEEADDAEWDEEQQGGVDELEEDEGEPLPTTERDPEVAKSLFNHIRKWIFHRVKYLKAGNLNSAVKYLVENVPEYNAIGSIEKFGELYKVDIRNVFNSLRNQCQTQMKNACFKYMDEHGGRLVSLESISKVRKSKSPEELDAFMFYWTVLLPCVSSLWKKHHKLFEKVLSEKLNADDLETVVTKNDEAYALFLYENCHSKWTAQYKNKHFNSNLPIPNPLYTLSGGKRGPDFVGRSDAGEARFKELVKHIKKDRAEDEGQKAELFMLKRLKNQNAK